MLTVRELNAHLRRASAYFKLCIKLYFAAASFNSKTRKITIASLESSEDLDRKSPALRDFFRKLSVGSVDELFSDPLLENNQSSFGKASLTRLEAGIL